jgi:HemY protein
MNRLVYLSLITLLTIAGFSMYQQNDIGLIQFDYAGHHYQTNFIVFIAAALSFAFAFMATIKIFQAIAVFFTSFGRKRKQRLQQKAQLSLQQGLIEYAEGRFDKSEKILLQQVEYSNSPLLVYLTAARAAQQQGAHDRRDEYLRKAHIAAPDADIAIGLTKAELQLAHQQNEQALATLHQLHKLSPEHSYVLTLLANTYKHLRDWDNLEKIIPQLKKHGHMSDATIIGFEIEMARGQLDQLAAKHHGELSDSQPLLDYWSRLPGHLTSLPQMIEYYAGKLVAVNAAGEAEKVLREYLNRNWTESTIHLYSELDVMVNNRQLEMAERWLDDHQHDAYLLYALGKMCVALSLWGKARNYLEASLAIKPMPENYLALARLLEEHMNDAAAAQEYYRQGLHLLAGDYGTDVLDKHGRDFERETPQLKIVKT